MAVDLNTLVPRLKASVNAPGSTFIAGSDPDWVTALSNAFWKMRLNGFYPTYRLDVDGVHIQTDQSGVELPGELQQLVVMAAAIDVIAAKLIDLETTFKAKSGDDEFEVQRSAQVLAAILKAKGDELKQLRIDLITNPSVGTAIGAVDWISSRIYGIYGPICGTGGWLAA